jgi:hypothetical protein
VWSWYRPIRLQARSESFPFDFITLACVLRPFFSATPRFLALTRILRIRSSPLHAGTSSGECSPYLVTSPHLPADHSVLPVLEQQRRPSPSNRWSIPTLASHCCYYSNSFETSKNPSFACVKSAMLRGSLHCSQLVLLLL